MKHILVPTDFSDYANCAVAYAIEIAGKCGGHIRFIHSVDAPIGWTQMPKSAEERFPEVQKAIAHARGQLQELIRMANDTGIDASQKLVFSGNLRDMTSFVQDKEQDLIVMGSHGRSGMQSLLLGSAAARTMRISQIPVLVIQKLPDEISFDNIVFASGLEEDTRDVFSRLLSFAKSVRAKHLHFVEVTTQQNFKPSGLVEDEIAQFLQPFAGHDLEIHNYSHYNVEAGIIEFSRRIGADLIALASHGRSDLQHIFYQSIPENLVKHADLPVLSIRV